METLTTASRDYWREVLAADGFTPIPRWTAHPTPGIAVREAEIPADQVGQLQRLAQQLGVSLTSVLLAAQAKTLAALSGEQEVVTGYAPVDDGRAVPVRLTTEPSSWRALVRHTHEVESSLRLHLDYPVADLKAELGLSAPSFDTVLDATGERGDLDEHVVLQIGVAGWDSVSGQGQPVLLQLRYRTDALDADYAARIAGYHLTALALMSADPDAEHGRQSLLSSDELNFQLHELSGPTRTLPNARMHELFEQRVQAQPDAVAALHRDQQWTYAQLNSRANQLARALLARGLAREGVVAVVTERNLDWMAAVLAIFKAGGVYLPLEPHFPPARIATALSRAECRLVLTENGSCDTLEQALSSLPDTAAIFIHEAYEEKHADGNIGIPVTPDQLAYILFTSGSTGEPKGAMCEHEGMLNHMYAKIDDLGVRERDVIPQTGPQCFDISVWQLLASLLVGGRTLLVDQEVILDVQRLVDTLVEGRAGVLQVVPSYLEVLVTYLEAHPRELPDLHCVCPTGDFLKKELTERWFAVQPTIRMVNTYGLTETSDDAVHEIMEQAPEGERVPLGRPINNVPVYVVDENLVPVPLGAPGVIAFAGVCVGRGYVNDPERTRSVFMADPHRPGGRLCRTGDYGRWQPGGKLDFLGRRDNQVKISGFRIEIGEIENGLLRVPGVRDGAAVVAERADRTKYLVAFYSSAQPLDMDLLRAKLSEALPAYMVPSSFHWQQNLPLTPNGKIDRKSLTALCDELQVTEEDYDAPATPTEQRLAGAWATVLGLPQDQIGRQDHFFDRGGTSLSAVKLAVALDRAVSLKDITRHPVLADLGAAIDDRSAPRSGLLQALSEGSPTAALVCFPYAGGNAVNFLPMASALRGTGIGVYAVELPGHDLAPEREPFAPLGQLVDRVVAEIAQAGLPRILLWGHSAGTAYALETARRLHERGVEVQRVFLAAQLPENSGSRLAAMAEMGTRTDAEIAVMLSANGGYTELGELDEQRAQHVGEAFRHDFLSAQTYFADAMDNPPQPRLTTPVTVVVAADDLKTPDYRARYQDWERLVEHVDLHVLDDGGHYFLRTRPAEAVEAVLRHVDQLTASPR